MLRIACVLRARPILAPATEGCDFRRIGQVLLLVGSVTFSLALFPQEARAQFVCVGNATGALTPPGTADGDGATATGAGSVACGTDATASGTNAIAVGRDATTLDGATPTRDAIAIGAETKAFGQGSVAIGSVDTSGAPFPLEAANASGDLSVAIGQGSRANVGVLNSGGTAVGARSSASGQVTSAFGFASSAGDDFASAYGNASNAQGDHSSAFGRSSFAEGSSSVAFGAGSHAVGTAATAVGSAIFTSPGSTTILVNGPQAIGDRSFAGGVASVAQGTSSLAMGDGAEALMDNSTAIGTGAQATRAGQQAFGTATNTYTMAGISSAASKAAQSGPTQLVTTDANGNLATDGGAIQSQINALGKRDDELAEGIAISLALNLPIFHAGQTFAVNVGWGGFDGENALGFTAAGVVNQGGLGPGSTVTLYGGVGAGGNEGTVAGKSGVSFGF